MSPEYVQPYVKSQNTDDRDVEAIAEAATRPTMRLVTPKSEAQLDLQVLHRARERLVTARTRLTNQLRAVLLERRVILPKRRAPLRHRLHELMAGELPISPRVIRLLQDLCEEWASLDERIRAYDDDRRADPREPAGSTTGDHPRDRRDQRDRTPGCCWRRLRLRQGTRSCGLVSSGLQFSLKVGFENSLIGVPFGSFRRG
jgi:hypothetical protein